MSKLGSLLRDPRPLLLLFACLLTLPVMAQTTTAPARPNIIILLTDDLRWDYLGCAGHPLLKTPAIDALAAQGVYFENAFVSTPLCSPSRATLLTGLSSIRHGIGKNGGQFPARLPNIGQQLQKAGYKTAFFGKTGFTNQPPGFDHMVDFLSTSAGGRGDTYNKAVFTVNGTPVPTDGFSTDALTKLVLDYLQEVEGPFFAVVSVKNPHVPFTPPSRHAKLFVGDQVPLPESYQDDVTDLPAQFRHKRGDTKPVFLSRPMRLQYEVLERNASKTPPGPRLVRKYLKMIPSIDETLGAIEGALQERGLTDQTALIFTSDNGLMLGEKGIFGKEILYEDSIRVPLIVRAPGCQAGSRSAAPVLNLDLAPTVLAWAGVKTDLPGRDITPLLRGETPEDWRSETLLLAGHSPNLPRPMMLGLRGVRYKYIRYVFGGIEEELFDLQADPQERNDLSDDPAHAAALEELRTRFEDLAKRSDVPGGWLSEIPR